MKNGIKGFVVGVAAMAVFSCGLSYAKSRVETIEVTYDNIKVYKDNVLCELKDSKGNVIEPFIYEGTTYLPARGTANLADMEVTWDGETKSIYLWDDMVAEGTYLMDVCKPYETNGNYTEYLQTNGKSFLMSGEKYSNGFTLGGSLSSASRYALFNLNSKYSEIELTIGHVDGSTKKNATVSFLVDDELIKEIEISPEDLPKTIKIPVKYGLQLKIIQSGSTTTGFGNITVQ
ncbi:MAG: hypothetical protein LUG52_06010 [Clostridia bacterium]|nr:hypothetical protein [Clostridia bacterium]